MEPVTLLVAQSTDFSLWGMWAQMGVVAKAVLVGLVVMFFAGLTIIGERVRAYARAGRQSLRYVLALQGHLRARQLQEAATEAGRYPDSPVAKVVGAGLREYLQGLRAPEEEGPRDAGDFDLVDAVHRQMERTKERETANLKRGLTSLATLGSTAPFVGLLGTVVGIINAFQGLSADAGGGLASVAGGISEALVATAVGLVVAIPAVMAFNFFNGRVEGFVIDMNDVASEVIDLVLKEGRVP